MNLLIRKAVSSDAEALQELYGNHLAKSPPKEQSDICKWREKLEMFEQNPYYHILVGEINHQVISSVTLIIIENLTNNIRPYALIENVVTHIEFRGNHYATKLMDRASAIAKEHNCYKIMLLTGSKLDTTLRFYENNGFNQKDKTAFIKWL